MGQQHLKIKCHPHALLNRQLMPGNKEMNWFDRKENWKAQNDDARDAGDIDYARIIHSASFRR